MKRITIYLPAEDLAALRKIAAEKKISFPELVRREMRPFLDSQKGPSREELWRRARSAMGKFHSGKGDIAQRHDDYLAEDYLK
jgi:hypothetical protein